MKNNITKLFVTLLKYGLALGFLRIVVSLLFLFQNQHISGARIIFLIHITLSICLASLAFFDFKKLISNNVKAKEALILGFGISILSGIQMFCFSYILTNYLDLDFFQNQIGQHETFKLKIVPIKFFILLALNPIIILLWVQLTKRLGLKLF